MTPANAAAQERKAALISDQLITLSALISVHPEVVESFRACGPLDRMCLYVRDRDEMAAFRAAAGDAEVPVVETDGEDSAHTGITLRFGEYLSLYVFTERGAS